jgi:hypothetical protein
MVRLSREASLNSSERWSPNGRYLAVVLDRVAEDCAVVIFASPPHAAFRPVARITSAAFYDRNLCDVGIDAWSLDGERIRLASRGLADPPAIADGAAIADVGVGPLLRAGVVGSLDITPGAFHAADAGTPLPVRGWYPASAMFVYLDRGDRALRGVDPMTGKVVTLLSLPDRGEYRITGATWTVDGKQLLVVVDGPTPCPDCGVHYRSEIYLYTPPTPG